MLSSAKFRVFALGAAIAVSSGYATAQFAPSSLALQRLTRQSGMIFSGTVTKIEFLRAASPAQVDKVEISFHVSDGIRGVRSGESVTISEWAGLWASGERYRVGQRITLFLYPPSRLGLTSPVTGDRGRFTADRYGNVRLSGTLARRYRRRALMPYSKFIAEVRRVLRAPYAE